MISDYQNGPSNGRNQALVKEEQPESNNTDTQLTSACGQQLTDSTITREQHGAAGWNLSERAPGLGPLSAHVLIDGETVSAVCLALPPVRSNVSSGHDFGDRVIETAQHRGGSHAPAAEIASQETTTAAPSHIGTTSKLVTTELVAHLHRAGLYTGFDEKKSALVASRANELAQSAPASKLQESR